MSRGLVRGIEVRVKLAVELCLAVVDHHRRRLDAQVPGETGTLSHVRAESLKLLDFREHRSIGVSLGQL